MEVNQRALIDKVLARYSEEFTGTPRDYFVVIISIEPISSTVFRELLQNSDDASARAVEIHFETEAFLQRAKDGEDALADSTKAIALLPDLKTTHVRTRWVMSFRLCKHTIKVIGASMDIQE